MFRKKYLTLDQLLGFDQYKYHSVDTSFFSVHVMHPFWNWCVQFFPSYIAPNVLTFLGFSLTVLNFILIGYYDYHFKAATLESNPIPKVVWIVAAFNMFIAYTLDGIDGKQARKIGISGPLGELFDHGLDSYSCLFAPVYLFSLFGTHDFPPIRMHCMTICVFLNFYLTHFEKYNTKVMFMPFGYDYLMWGVTLVLASAAVLGSTVWTTEIYGWKPTVIFEILLYSSSTITSHPVIAWNIYKSYRDKTGKLYPFFEAIRPLHPLFALFFVTTVWALCSKNNILDEEPRMFFILSGTIFSNITCRLIVAQMSGQRTDGWNFQLSILSLVTVICIIPYHYLEFDRMSLLVEKSILYTLTIIITSLHIHYGIGVVREMCKHFKIDCFTVAQKQRNEVIQLDHA